MYYYAQAQPLRYTLEVAVSASGSGNRHNITVRLTSNQSLVSAGPLHKVAYTLFNSAKHFHRGIVRMYQ